MTLSDLFTTNLLLMAIVTAAFLSFAAYFADKDGQ